MAFTARYGGTCSACGKPINIGQLINWNRKQKGRVYHADCSAPDTPAPARESVKTEIVAPIKFPVDVLKYISDSDTPAVVVSTPLIAALEEAPKVHRTENKNPLSKLRVNSPWPELLRAVLPYVRRVLLIGPPGTGKSTAAMQIAGTKHRITMTETTSEDALLGMWHLRDGRTVWIDGPLTTAMKQGEPVLIDEVDHYSPEAASLLYSLIDDNPHVETPEGSVSAKDGYKMILTANEGLETLPVAVQDRIEVIIQANAPAEGSLADVANELRSLSQAYYKTLPKQPIAMPATVRRIRTFDTLLNVGFKAEVAASLVFGDNKEVLSVASSLESRRKMTS